MKHLFIINPVAGKIDRSVLLRRKIEETMTPRGLPWEIVVTEYPRHGTELTQRAAQTGEELRVYACGGDGTLNEVAAGAAGYPNVSVTHWPTGSGNDFIKCFGDDASRFFDLGELLDCQVSTLDVIDCNGRLAINVCSVGFDARVGLEMAEFKQLPLVSGTMAYHMSLLKNVIKGINRDYYIEVTAPDGTLETLKGKFGLLCICNGRYYGGSYHPSPDAVPDDGVLNCVLVHKVSRLTFAKLVGKYAVGRAGDYPTLIDLRPAVAVKIQCDRVSKINLDGERLDGTVITISLSAKKVNFAHPRGSSWTAK